MTATVEQAEAVERGVMMRDAGTLRENEKKQTDRKSDAKYARLIRAEYRMSNHAGRQAVIDALVRTATADVTLTVAPSTFISIRAFRELVLTRTGYILAPLARGESWEAVLADALAAGCAGGHCDGRE